ncbi:hypothetical protein [Halobacteriovorax sp. RZ-2]|uniref:hypothetical protein n=1 Tax=unclassified Halobacteriovorax TaxID=2639665 RepID=UPI0037131697
MTKNILRLLLFVTISITCIQASGAPTELAPFDQAGSYFDEDQGLIIGSDGLRYWHQTNNTMKNENGVIFKFRLFSIKASDGKRYKKASRSHIKENWELKRYPVKLSQRMLTIREDAGVDFKELSNAIENGDSIYLSKQERDSLSAYLRVRQHEQDSWDGSFRTNRTGRTTCTTVGMNTVCTTTSY